MKRILFSVLVLLFLINSPATQAFTPAPGFWYNPAESGRGFTIDSQDSIMAVASYVFNKQGQPIWYTSAGTYSETTSTFTSTFDGASGGQCFGCTYAKPSSSPAAGGSMKIVFTDFEHGTLYFPGGSTPIEHFVYGYAGKTGYLYGAWAFSYNINGLVSAQWVSFTNPYTGSDGTVYAQGQEPGLSGTVALGAFVTSGTESGWIVDIYDGQFSNFYLLQGGTDRMLGNGTIVTGDNAPTTIPYPAAASRILTPSELASSSSTALTGVSVPQSRYQKMEADIKTMMPILMPPHQ